jgi:phosphate transport system substrate-binding protein
MNYKLGLMPIFTLLTLGSVACNQRNPETTIDFPDALEQAKLTSSTALVTGNIKIDGSSTVYPISQAMREEFGKYNPDVKFTLDVSGTGGGFDKFCAGETDISGASRPINSKEMEQCQQNQVEYIELPVAFDGLAIVINAKNDFVDCLKLSELKKIWEPSAEGQIKNWNQVNDKFPNQPLNLYAPDSKSGTYDYFTLAVVGEEGTSRSDYAASELDTEIVKGITTDLNSLGYFSYSYYLTNQDKLKLVAVNSGAGCVLPSPQTIADSRYQPLSRPVFLYVKKAAAKRPEVRAFTSFYLDPENADLIIDVGDVPLPNITLRAAKARFDRGETGTKFAGEGAVLNVGQGGL